MAKNKYTVRFVREIEVEMDDDLLPDDYLREHYYRGMNSQDQLAAHIAWNAGINGASHVEGLTPDMNKQYTVKDNDWIEWGWAEADVTPDESDESEAT